MVDRLASQDSVIYRCFMAENLPRPLWDFVVQVYALDGVKEACLALQERRDVDVSLLLFSVWAGKIGHGVFSTNILKSVLKISDEWQTSVIKPLRKVRNFLKNRATEGTKIQVLRISILENELSAERQELTALGDLFSGDPNVQQSENSQIDHALRNTLDVLKSSKVGLTEEDLRDIKIICAAVFSEESKFPNWLDNVNAVTAPNLD
ncbi:TIGR02444 family protein [Alphaproteobacteria bacterium 46_93_T64]|nr:TIGR02444 family protein [Alphaproteobacteria bacterium 46_93_T64]